MEVSKERRPRCIDASLGEVQSIGARWVQGTQRLKVLARERSQTVQEVIDDLLHDLDRTRCREGVEQLLSRCGGSGVVEIGGGVGCELDDAMADGLAACLAQ